MIPETILPSVLSPGSWNPNNSNTIELRMPKEKRKQSKDEENDSSSRKRRKADLSNLFKCYCFMLSGS
ncbi:hypothetical protein NC651_018987 [Populus alba x Populus x berolinensis]|nr:hypothetical protein NC651_018987 [Populus alba x Populus x berolinensis]